MNKEQEWLEWSEAYTKRVRAEAVDALKDPVTRAHWEIRDPALVKRLDREQEKPQE